MLTRKRWLVMMIGAVALFCSGLCLGRASAAEYPQVGTLKAFSAEANYMSLPGYLRYLIHSQDGTWLSRPECERIVKQQQGK